MRAGRLLAFAFVLVLALLARNASAGVSVRYYRCDSSGKSCSEVFEDQFIPQQRANLEKQVKEIERALLPGTKLHDELYSHEAFPEVRVYIVGLGDCSEDKSQCGASVKMEGSFPVLNVTLGEMGTYPVGHAWIFSADELNRSFGVERRPEVNQDVRRKELVDTGDSNSPSAAVSIKSGAALPSTR